VTDEADAAHPAPPAGLAELPPAVREQVLVLAARGLGALVPGDVPPRLRTFARFAPQRRARLAAGPLAEALADPVFRRRVADALAASGGPVASAATPGDAAVRARQWLTGPVESPVPESPVPGSAVSGSAVSGSAVPASAGSAGPERADERVRRLAAALDEARTAARQERVASRRELATVRAEVKTAKAATESAARETRAARAELLATRAAADLAQAAAAASARDADAALRRLRRQVEDLTADLAAARRDTRAGREFADTRVRLLVDTLEGAVAGLSRELGLATAGAVVAVAPVDTVTARTAPVPNQLDARAESWDAPGTLARFLALPKAHLLVDGYNVTKAALPTLPLARQRELLLRNLAGLAAQTGGEVTVVFDGADVTAVPAVGIPGVRVRFSPLGISADEVLRAMARAEPPGRPVVVVSSDREVADGVRRAGATAVGAAVLVRRLLGG
jgi:predicted RNA-binding protein with PIN domain